MRAAEIAACSILALVEDQMKREWNCADFNNRNDCNHFTGDVVAVGWFGDEEDTIGRELKRVRFE